MLKVILAFSLVLAMPFAATAQEKTAGDAWLISLGGKLYDNHWLETGTAPPMIPNPLYPAGIDVKPANTWRCVACHGWDYRGRDGHLGQLSKVKIFGNLSGLAGAPVDDIVKVLQSGIHAGMVQPLNPGQVKAIAMFISAGQNDTSMIFKDGKATGDPARGKDIFEGACMSCHQADGKAFIEGESGDVPALGWVALNKPQQALHKITNGVPGADMLSMRFLQPSQLADLIAYLQTLDTTPEQE